MQQLRDVYGDSVDKIVQGNTSNIVFLKSTDDSMLDTLQKMSGTTHKSYIDSKTVTMDKQRLFMQVESKLSYTVTTKEVPVIMYNDMAFIAERNSIVFRAGDPPVWNRNQTILPMSWRLFKNTIVHAGHDYSLQTIPTLSSALDFDVRKNQPDFRSMIEKRKAQALQAGKVYESYQNAYGYSDLEMSQLDPDALANEIMSIIDEKLRNDKNVANGSTSLDDDEDFFCDESTMMVTVPNTEQLQANAVAKQKMQTAQRKLYAGQMLSKEDLVPLTGGGVNHAYDKDIIEAYKDVKAHMWKDNLNFRPSADGCLYGQDGTPYIVKQDSSADLQNLDNMAKDKNSRVFAEAKIDKNDVSSLGSYTVMDAFYHFLVSKDKWTFANGEFERAMASRMRNS